MKTTVPREEFLEALTATAAVAGARTTKTILNCVKLATEADSVDLSATDGETALRLRMSAFRVDEPGEAVVPAERLVSIVREMPDAEIRVTADQRYCVVSGAGSEFKIFVHPAADFPIVPAFDDEADLAIDGQKLWHMISQTIYAAARETSRYAINGVLWEKRGKRLYLVATDGRRLARAGGALQRCTSADFEAIVPAKALGAFERVFAPGRVQGEWVVGVKVMPNQIVLRSGDRMLSTVLVEGTFPKYQDVIPKDSNREVQIDRTEFSGAIKRAALLTSDDARAVKLSFERDRLIITAQSPEQGEARVEQPVQFDGEAMSISFNPVFVNDALRALSSKGVQLELQDSFRPGVLSAGDKDEFLYVIMPVST